MKIFRIISILEGLSYLLILSISFGVLSRDYVFPVGASHGVLFITYLMLSLQVSHKQKWPILKWLLVFIASIIPFAFVAVEVQLRKELKQLIAGNSDI